MKRKYLSPVVGECRLEEPLCQVFNSEGDANGEEYSNEFDEDEGGGSFLWDTEAGDPFVN